MRRMRIMTAAVAVLTAAAAGIHLGVVGEHLDEWWATGVFFGAAAAAQLVCAILIRVGRTRWLTVAAAIHLSLIAIWVVSRTIGVPAGPHAGVREVASLLDATTVVLQLGAVVGAAAVLRWRRSMVPPWPARRALAPASAAMTTLSLALVVALGPVPVHAEAPERSVPPAQDEYPHDSDHSHEGAQR